MIICSDRFQNPSAYAEGFRLSKKLKEKIAPSPLGRGFSLSIKSILPPTGGRKSISRRKKGHFFAKKCPSSKRRVLVKKFYDLKIRLRNLSGYAAFLFLSYFILSATAVVTATSKR